MKILLFLIFACFTANSYEESPYVVYTVYNDYGQEFIWVKNNTPNWLMCHVVSIHGTWPFKVAPWAESRRYPFARSKVSQVYCR